MNRHQNTSNIHILNVLFESQKCNKYGLYTKICSTVQINSEIKTVFIKYTGCFKMKESDMWKTLFFDSKTMYYKYEGW